MLRSVLADLVRTFPDLMISVSRVITTGDVVTALFKAEGTQAANYAGAINTEKQWVPPWRPADITDCGREQLRAIGFDPR